jgi:hypothetical protein
MRRNVLHALAGGPRQYVLFPVIYNVSRQEEIVSAAIDEGFGIVDKLKLAGKEWFLWQQVGIQLWTFILRFKNPVFEEEQEWRIMNLPYSGIEKTALVRFRVTGGSIIPYIELSITREVISRIVQGPSLHPVLGRMAVKMLLAESGFDSETPFELSKIPLRG